MNYLNKFKNGVGVVSAAEVVYFYIKIPWWRHQMETFSEILALCAENSPVTGEFP